MPPLPQMRAGTELKANSRTVPFSFFPTSGARPRPAVHSLLFAVDPWLIIRRAVEEAGLNPNERREALSYLVQAEDFYRSAQGSLIGAAKPLQLYYAYLNLAKTLVITRRQQNTLSNVQHGISESVVAGGNEFFDATLTFFHSPNGRNQLQAFDELVQSLNAHRLPNSHELPLGALLPQILPGHRLWASAAEKPERFIATQSIGYFVNTARKKVWLRVYIFADDVRRLGLTQDDVLRRSGLSIDFKKVRCDEQVAGRKLICFEQRVTHDYTRHGVDLTESISAEIKDQLWVTVASTPPYRRYYLYLCPNSERPHLVPQLGSIYALTYYLGSITRYRPTVYQDILDGKFGPRIAEFVSSQTAQFVYLMASEFVRREVSKPSII